MPILKDFRQSKILTLPSFPDSKVEVYDSLLVGQMMNSGVKVDDTPIQQGIKVLPLYIKSWNFQDEENKPLEVNEQSIGLLPQDDLVFILNEITEFSKVNKKKENQ